MTDPQPVLTKSRRETGGAFATYVLRAMLTAGAGLGVASVIGTLLLVLLGGPPEYRLVSEAEMLAIRARLVVAASIATLPTRSWSEALVACIASAAVFPIAYGLDWGGISEALRYLEVSGALPYQARFSLLAHRLLVPSAVLVVGRVLLILPVIGSRPRGSMKASGEFRA